MSTLSSSESSPDGSHLSSFVEAHYERLRDGPAPKWPGSVKCRLIQRDRNAVYRLSGSQTWYLKIPRHGDDRVVRRELAGGQILAGVDTASYGLDFRTIGRLSPPYLLSAALPGRSLNMTLYLSCLLPGLASSRTTTAFHNFGRIVGALHAAPVPADTLPTDRSLARLPGLVFDSDEAEIERTATMTQAPVHGNLGLRNVLTYRTKIGLIDFENFGAGSIYDDLSVVGVQLALMQVVDFLPKAHLFTCLQAFFDAYGRHRAFDAALLAGCVSIRVRDFRARAVKAGKTPRIAGIPVRMARVDRLHHRLRNDPGSFLTRQAESESRS